MRSIKLYFVVLLIGITFLLNINFSSSISSEANHTFYISCVDGACTDSGMICNLSRADEGYSDVLFDPSNIPNACKFDDGSTCCPSGKSCQLDEERGAYFCVPLNKFCSYYEEGTDSYPLADSPFSTREEACNADPLNLGSLLKVGEDESGCGELIGSIEEDGTLIDGVYRIENCSCEWDSGSCKNVYTASCEYTNSCDDDGNNGGGDGNNDGNSNNPSKIYCSYDYEYTECNENNIQTYSWTAVGKDSSGRIITDSRILTNAGCVSGGPVSRPCGKPTIELPGFSFFALILSLALIFVLYFFRIKEN